MSVCPSVCLPACEFKDEIDVEEVNVEGEQESNNWGDGGRMEASTRRRSTFSEISLSKSSKGARVATLGIASLLT